MQQIVRSDLRSGEKRVDQSQRPRIQPPISDWQTNKLECGPMPNVMVALPNTGGALCSKPQSLA